MTTASAGPIVTYETEARLQNPDLDLAYIEDVASDLAAALHGGQPAEVAYQPGDGTFYGLVFTPLRRLATARPRVKDGVQWDRRSCRGMLSGGRGDSGDKYDPTGYLVSHVENVAYPVRLGGRDGRDLAADYVGEHWNCRGESAVSLAILFRAVSHFLDEWASHDDDDDGS